MKSGLASVSYPKEKHLLLVAMVLVSAFVVSGRSEDQFYMLCSCLPH